MKFYFIIIIVFAVYFFSGFLSSCNQPAIDKSNADSVAADVKPALLYGLPVDSFRIVKGKVAKNQTLSDILKQNYATDLQINYLVKLTKKQKIIIHAGQPYVLFFSADSPYALRYFVYEHHISRYSLFNFCDTLEVTSVDKQFRSQTCIRSGIINTSLWDATRESQINPSVALELSEIFAWTIDFFALQKNDSFRVIYSEMYVDSIPAGITAITGAKFFHAGNVYYAISFEQDGKVKYFDENGNSLQRNFLKAPLRFSRISSKYTGKRLHPVLRILRPHYGVDYAAAVGTPVYSTADGIVVETGSKAGEGNYIKIKHNSVYTTGYLHLQSFARNIHKGAKVAQKQVIGYVGNSGLSTGPHLDYRVWKNGSPVNPLKMESQPIEPVKDQNRKDFEIIKNKIISLLGE